MFGRKERTQDQIEREWRECNEDMEVAEFLHKKYNACHALMQRIEVKQRMLEREMGKATLEGKCGRTGSV